MQCIWSADRRRQCFQFSLLRGNLIFGVRDAGCVCCAITPTSPMARPASRTCGRNMKESEGDQDERIDIA